MKKALVMVSAVILFCAAVEAKEAALAPDPMEGASSGMHEASSPVADSERSKELLEIWKEHVRTLTRERDAAQKELEELRTQTPSEVSAGSMAARELEEARRDNETLMRDKEEALAAIDSLKKQLAAQGSGTATEVEVEEKFSRLKEKYEETASELRMAEQRLDQASEENEKLRRIQTEMEAERVKARIRELEAEKAEPAAKMQTPAAPAKVEGEALTAIAKKKDEVLKQIRDLKDANTAAAAESVKNAQVRQALEESNEKLGIEKAKLEQAVLSLNKQNAAMEEEIRLVSADKENAYSKLEASQNLEKELRAEIEKAKIVSAELATARQRVTELEKSNNALKSADLEHLKDMEGYKAKLGNAQSEIQSLKANFASTLESIAAGLEENPSAK